MNRAYLDPDTYKRVKLFAAKNNLTVQEAHEKIINKTIDKEGNPKVKELGEVVL